LIVKKLASSVFDFGTELPCLTFATFKRRKAMLRFFVNMLRAQREERENVLRSQTRPDEQALQTFCQRKRRIRVRGYVYICSPAYSRSVYVAGVHVHGAHQAVFLMYAT
jgi:hypothetical protein